MITNQRRARRSHQRNQRLPGADPVPYRKWARHTFKRAAPHELSPHLARIVHGGR